MSPGTDQEELVPEFGARLNKIPVDAAFPLCETPTAYCPRVLRFYCTGCDDELRGIFPGRSFLLNPRKEKS